MRLIVAIVTGVLVFASETPAHADALKTPAEARQLTDRIMTKVGSGEVDAGIRLMKPYVATPETDIDGVIDSWKKQEPRMTQRFGNVIGTELVREDKLGESLLRVIQLARYEVRATFWSFYFYRGKNGWVLSSFNTDDDIVAIFPR